MTIKMHKVWFDGDNLVTQEIPEEQIYEYKTYDMKAKALQLADEVLAKEYAPRLEIAKELRRLHSENEQLKARPWVGLDALETVYKIIIDWDECGGKRSRRELARRIVDLYITPPQRLWVGLTDEEIKVFIAHLYPLPEKPVRERLQALLTKLRERNT